jgi:hypothetical protein
LLATGFTVFGAGSAAAEAWPTAAEVNAVFSGLSASETADLTAGVPVIRVAAKAGVAVLKGDAVPVQEIARRFKKLAPNYYGEYLYVRQYDRNCIDALESLLTHPERFVGLPYFSKRQQTNYELLDSLVLLTEQPAAEGGTMIKVMQHMEPFNEYQASYTIVRRIDEISFNFTNDGPLIYSYRNFKAASAGDMAWSIYVFGKDGWLWFYGAGGVKAFDLFGAFRDRLETSFMGRIEAFFGFAIKTVSG